MILLISYFKQKRDFWKKVPRKLRNEISPAETSYRTYGVTTLHLSTRFPHPLSMQLRLCIYIILIYVLHFQDIRKLPHAFVRDHFPRKVDFVQIYHAWNFEKNLFSIEQHQKSATNIIIRHTRHTIEFQSVASIIQWPQTADTITILYEPDTFTQLMAPLDESRWKYFADI